MGQTDGELDLGSDAAWVAAALVLVASLSGAVVLAEWPFWGVQPEQPEDPDLITVGDAEAELWPYTARVQRFEARTLGINVVFDEDSADVETALRERSALQWEEEESIEPVANGTNTSERVRIDPEAERIEDAITFQDAEGAKRYTYVETDGGGVWLDESYQLHSGTYLGARLHIRAYDDPNGKWTAVQVHEEHWDWFRLRHTVTGIDDAQRRLEADFMGEPYVEEVVRLPFGNRTADGDGWATVIRLAALSALLFGFAGNAGRIERATRRFVRRQRRELALGAVVFGLYLAVRFLGIAGEAVATDLSPKLVAAPLYLCLALGTPTAAYLLGRGSNRTWAFVFAAAGLGTAFVVDFAAMGVSLVPLRVVLHRAAVLTALGLIALGGALAADRDEYPPALLVGLAGWLLALLAPLFGYL
ncbi:hypothetical protein [Natronomonas amylolytica]|uniref:hypothetical protein n=1 Tax=Natronomonas amylolytica TaxID=3108498 RepID=UPI003009CC6C